MLKVINTFLGAEPDSLTSWSFVLIHLNLVIYALAFWIQQPAIPEKLKSISANEVEYGTIQSVSAILAFCGSTFMGRIVDVYGAKTGFMLAQLASGFLYLISFSATNINIFYLTAFPSFFQHAMLCASAAVASLSLNENRHIALGRVGLSYGIGMASGSSLGGIISNNFGMSNAFLTSAIMSFAITILNFFLLPTLRSESKQEQGTTGDVDKNLNMGAIFRVAGSSVMVQQLLIISILSGLGTSAFRAMFSLAAVEEFHLTSQDLGFLLSFTAVIGLITNVFVIGWVVAMLGENVTLITSMFIQGICFLGMFYVGHSPNSLLVISIPQSMASTIFYTLSSSIMTKLVRVQDQGTIVSLGHASRSITQVIAPIVGGMIMNQYKFAGVGLLSALLSFSAGSFATFVFMRKVHPNTEED